jgi:serine-type D-Ala-D-Ala carboxypeptidase/endopeptidase (penicillin-binding protein 4)
VLLTVAALPRHARASDAPVDPSASPSFSLEPSASETAAPRTDEGAKLQAAPAPFATPQPSAGATSARPRWIRRIDRLTAGRPISVCIGVNGRFVYRRKADVLRTPASNEKLLLSMALLDGLGADHRIATRAAARSTTRTVRGRLWILGAGDPEIDRGRLRALAKQVRAAGVRRIHGRVMGSTGYFRHDWWAAGWKPSFPATEVALPTALTFEGNQARGRHIVDPERRAAASLTKQLRAVGVHVRGRSGAGRPPRDLRTVGRIRSQSLGTLLRHQNVDSRNFYAEVLGKLLGAERSGPPGTIRKGARAIEAWARSFGVHVEAHDGSGLSYKDRLTAAGMVRLLWVADGATWTGDLRGTLPAGGQGTLAHRLRTIDVRAKTGTLDRISALSGWVRLERSGVWAEFSILSRGISKDAAVRIEDRIVHAVAANTI